MAVTGGGRAVRIKVESVAKSGRAGMPEKAVALTGGERVAEVTYVAERDRPEFAVGDEAEEAMAVESTEGESTDPESVDTMSAEAESAMVESLEAEPEDAIPRPPDDDERPPSPGSGAAELDLFG